MSGRMDQCVGLTKQCVGSDESVCRVGWICVSDLRCLLYRDNYALILLRNNVSGRMELCVAVSG